MGCQGFVARAFALADGPLLQRKNKFTRPLLDSDLIHFVRTHVRSIWALEVLLLLRSKAPAALTQEEIVSALRASPGLISRIVDQLAAANLIVDESGACRFECDPALAKLCEALEAAAQDRPIALRDAIASSPNHKLRNFSEAFRLKGKDKDRDGDDQ